MRCHILFAFNIHCKFVNTSNITWNTREQLINLPNDICKGFLAPYVSRILLHGLEFLQELYSFSLGFAALLLDRLQDNITYVHGHVLRITVQKKKQLLIIVTVLTKIKNETMDTNRNYSEKARIILNL